MFATAVISSATRLAGCAPRNPWNNKNSSRYASVLATPMPANRTSWRVSPAGTPGVPGSSGARPSCSRSAATGSRPVASARDTRATPRRSAIAVATTSTRLSGSSTQSTGTSWMRSPDRSASTSSSVSKNQPSSSTSGSNPRATSARIALNPHWASENRAASVPRRMRL